MHRLPVEDLVLDFSSANVAEIDNFVARSDQILCFGPRLLDLDYFQV